MNIKRFCFAVLAVFGFVFLFEFLVHGMLLKGLYEETASLWRPQEDYNMMHMVLMQIAFSATAVFFFTRHYENKGVGEGVRFGAYLGLVLAVVEIASYKELLENLPNRRVNTILSCDKLINTGYIPRSASDALEWCLENYDI